MLLSAKTSHILAPKLLFSTGISFVGSHIRLSCLFDLCCLGNGDLYIRSEAMTE